MTHQNVRKKKGFYPIIITCLLCLLFLKKNGVVFLTMARLRLPFDMHFTQKTYYFQKIVESPFLGQKLQITHQNVRKKEGFYPIIITCLLCLLFMKKMATLKKTPAKTAFFNVDLGTLAKFSIYLLISPLEPKKKFQLQENRL